MSYRTYDRKNNKSNYNYQRRTSIYSRNNPNAQFINKLPEEIAKKFRKRATDIVCFITPVNPHLPMTKAVVPKKALTKVIISLRSRLRIHKVVPNITERQMKIVIAAGRAYSLTP